MTLHHALAALAGALFVVFLVSTAIRPHTPVKGGWVLPALLSLAFLAFSAYTVWTEGPLGFWTEHTRNFWGNQIWLDLLLAASIGWLLIVPRARALGMHLPLWLALIAATGSIGFLAMVARLLYLSERQPGRNAV